MSNARKTFSYRTSKYFWIWHRKKIKRILFVVSWMVKTVIKKRGPKQVPWPEKRSAGKHMAGISWVCVRFTSYFEGIYLRVWSFYGYSEISKFNPQVRYFLENVNSGFFKYMAIFGVWPRKLNITKMSLPDVNSNCLNGGQKYNAYL